MNIHFIQHETFEAPGAYLKWAEKRGHHITISRIFDHQSLPESAANIDFLIIMGGPQSPDTSQEECPHFDAHSELDLIRKCIDAEKLVLGVCLGAQLVGQALGATYEHCPEKEIGNFPIQLTEEGKKDEKLAHFGHLLTVGHWHNDMPGLTADSSILAISDGCPRQIIKYSDRVYAFQCHLEFSKDLVKLLIAHDEDLEAKSMKHRFVQSPNQILGYDYSEMNEKLYSFLDKLVSED